MRLVKILFYCLVGIAMAVLGGMFRTANQASVPLDLLVLYLPEGSVALWVLLAFAAGGAVGLLASLGIIVRLRTSLAVANRRLAKASPPAAPAAEPSAKPAAEPAKEPVVEA